MRLEGCADSLETKACSDSLDNAVLGDVWRRCDCNLVFGLQIQTCAVFEIFFCFRSRVIRFTRNSVLLELRYDFRLRKKHYCFYSHVFLISCLTDSRWDFGLHALILHTFFFFSLSCFFLKKQAYWNTAFKREVDWPDLLRVQGVTCTAHDWVFFFFFE